MAERGKTVSSSTFLDDIKLWTHCPMSGTLWWSITSGAMYQVRYVLSVFVRASCDLFFVTGVWLRTACGGRGRENDDRFTIFNIESWNWKLKVETIIIFNRRKLKSWKVESWKKWKVEMLKSWKCWKVEKLKVEMLKSWNVESWKLNISTFNFQLFNFQLESWKLKVEMLKVESWNVEMLKV